MTISREHPFLPPEPDRNPIRRFRGRMPLPVTVWTSAYGGHRAGWAVSSMLVADGDPPEIAGLLDEEADLADLIDRSGTVAVSLLGFDQRALADAFAEVAPAPGGPFRLGRWTDSDWGPVLVGAPAWLGARVRGGADHAGWARLVRGTVEHVQIDSSAEGAAVAYLRGRYRPLADD